jgi:hypothetical protein
MDADFLRKLGVKPGHRVALVKTPEDFQQAFQLAADGTCQLSRDNRPKDLIIAWPHKAEEVELLFARLCPVLRPEGAIWVVIPKKSATKGTPGFPTFPQVQAAGLAAGLVDNKDLSFSKTHYGIRFVVPVAARSRWNASRASDAGDSV